MKNVPNYIQWIRSKVGHDKIILIFAEVVSLMKREKYCYKSEGIAINGAFPVEPLN